LSHMPRPIKVTNTALSETMKADQITIETAKTGKVTVIVAVISNFSRKRANCGVPILEMRSLLAKRRKEPIFRRKYPRIEKLFSKIEKMPDAEEISV
jgi:hypothetical protein